jgi:hypothetical protein
VKYYRAEFDRFRTGAENKKWLYFGQLTVAERNPTLGQIVRRKLHRDLVARQNADSVAPEPSGKVRQDGALMFQLHAEQAARKLFQNGPGYFNTVFFTHSTSLQLAVKRGGRVLPQVFTHWRTRPTPRL